MTNALIAVVGLIGALFMLSSTIASKPPRPAYGPNEVISAWVGAMLLIVAAYCLGAMR